MATIDELIENFSILDDWEDKYQYLIELGEKLSPLDEKFKTIRNGKGVAVVVPISSVMGLSIYQFMINNRTNRGV